MDYIDWCLQAYVTFVTPVTYSKGFHDTISSILYALISFESVEALNVFVQNAVLYNAQTYIITFYWRVIILVVNNYLSLLHNQMVAISFLAAFATVISQTWSIYYYIIRSSFAAYTKLTINSFPVYSFPCVCTTANCDECKVA